MTDAGDDWTDDELKICVEVYAEVYRRGGAERKFSKDVFIARGEKALPYRGLKSVRLRMENINAVMDENGRPMILGWGVKRNVGTGVKPRIEALLRKHGLL